eukprot:2574093-Rhodomonas_salina.1
MLDAAAWLNGGYKVKSFARNAPYAQGSIIPGSNYSAQDNHSSLKVSGLCRVNEALVDRQKEPHNRNIHSSLTCEVVECWHDFRKTFPVMWRVCARDLNSETTNN